MLFYIFGFLLLTLVTYYTGLLFIKIISTNLLDLEKDEVFFVVILLGITILGSVLMYASLVVPLNLYSISIILFTVLLYNLKYTIVEVKKQIHKIDIFNIGMCLLSLVISSFFSISQDWTFDSYLYHCQAIRWLNLYGFIKGSSLASIQLSQPSMSFYLAAPFSNILGFNGYSVFGGFFLFLFTFRFAISTRKIINKQFSKADLFIFSCFLITFTIFFDPTESKIIAAPSPDGVTGISIFFTIWVFLIFEKTEQISKNPLVFLVISIMPFTF